MTARSLYWKPVTCKNVRGLDFQCDSPDIISRDYKGLLLEAILNMKPKDPISFERAIKLNTEKQIEAMKALDAKKVNWYYENFVQFISDSGFHIDLTGDEFVYHLSSADN